ncbi:MAG: hypothetical protein R3223_06670 [Longimicrobiales bacterium]|nr:hypothetical protein [Longimicrobiales bacterium]
MPEEGISRALAGHRARTLWDLRYDFRLSIPARTSEPVTGTLNLRLRRDDPDGGPLVLDFHEPARRIRSMSLNGADGEELSAEFVHDHLVVPGDALPRRGPVELRLDFEAGDA